MIKTLEKTGRTEDDAINAALAERVLTATTYPWRSSNVPSPDFWALAHLLRSSA
ncbi:MAG: hypothetical protein V8S72_05695 [Oscillospiraceae bacterium]